MKQTTNPDPTIPYFETPDHSPIAVRENTSVEAPDAPSEDPVLDRFLGTIKWVFLYLPGALTIHFIMMVLSSIVFYEVWPSLSMMLGTFGIFAVAAFMVMLGLGKLGELKYLRVVGALVAAGGLASVIYTILTAFTGGDFFGWFTLLSLPFTLLVAHLVKKNTDVKTDG